MREKRIQITVGDIELEGRLLDNEMAHQIEGQLPITGQAQVWGDEIYFEIPITEAELAGAEEEVDLGTLAYWPPGRTFCIFYGPTPVSRGDRPRAYSPVNVFGAITDDATVLRGIRSGVTVRVEARES